MHVTGGMTGRHSQIHDERPKHMLSGGQARKTCIEHSGEGKTSGISVRSVGCWGPEVCKGEQGTFRADAKTRC